MWRWNPLRRREICTRECYPWLHLPLACSLLQGRLGMHFCWAAVGPSNHSLVVIKIWLRGSALKKSSADFFELLRLKTA